MPKSLAERLDKTANRLNGLLTIAIKVRDAALTEEKADYRFVTKRLERALTEIETALERLTQ